MKLQQHPSIMLVENDIELSTMITEILDGEGLNVLTATDGLDALRLLSDGHKPDLILTDLNMPGLGGAELLARLKRDDKICKVPVILVSGAEGIEAKTTEIGAQAFLKKPYLINTLTALVKFHLH